MAANDLVERLAHGGDFVPGRDDLVERLAHGDDESLALGRQGHGVSLSAEELELQLVLELLDLLTDGRRRDVAFLGRPGEIRVTGRAFRDAEGVQVDPR